MIIINNDEDLALIEKVKNKDEERLKLLIKKYRGYIINTLKENKNKLTFNKIEIQEAENYLNFIVWKRCLNYSAENNTSFSCYLYKSLKISISDFIMHNSIVLTHKEQVAYSRNKYKENLYNLINRQNIEDVKGVKAGNDFKKLEFNILIDDFIFNAKIKKQYQKEIIYLLYGINTEKKDKDEIVEIINSKYNLKITTKTITRVLNKLIKENRNIYKERS